MADPKKIPISFNADGVRAILPNCPGKKTHTRRVIKPQPKSKHGPVPGDCISQSERRGIFSIRSEGEGVEQYENAVPFAKADAIEYWREESPYGEPGDILWVREPWQSMTSTVFMNGRFPVAYQATDARKEGHGPYEKVWHPPKDMPEWACRLWLKVASVRVEQVQDISEADAIAEGIGVSWSGAWRNYATTGKPRYILDPRKSFETLFDSIYASQEFGWDANPWVWVVEFEIENVGRR